MTEQKAKYTKLLIKVGKIAFMELKTIEHIEKEKLSTDIKNKIRENFSKEAIAQICKELEEELI